MSSINVLGFPGAYRVLGVMQGTNFNVYKVVLEMMVDNPKWHNDYILLKSFPSL